jgi:hypothetical protein
MRTGSVVFPACGPFSHPPWEEDEDASCFTLLSLDLQLSSGNWTFRNIRTKAGIAFVAGKMNEINKSEC